MFKKLDHIAIVVKNLDAAVKVFSEKYGFKAGETMTGPNQSFKAIMISAGDIRLELFEPIDPKGNMARFLKEKGGGLYHLAVSTDNIENEMKTLKDKGVRLANEKPVSIAGARIAFIDAESAENVSIEMVQRV